MEPLARLLVSLLELAEIELAMLKKSVVRLGLSLIMLIGAGVFGIIGTCWLLYAIFLWIAQLTNVPTAYAICGVVFLASSGILGLMAFGGSKPTKVVPTPVDESIKPKPGSPEGNPDDPASLRIAS